jgi:hypothetical protein
MDEDCFVGLRFVFATLCSHHPDVLREREPSSQ